MLRFGSDLALVLLDGVYGQTVWKCGLAQKLLDVVPVTVPGDHMHASGGSLRDERRQVGVYRVAAHQRRPPTPCGAQRAVEVEEHHVRL